MATTAAMDVTGILAATTVGALGFFILPARKRKARTELRRRSAELERQLTDVLRDGFEAELARSIRRIRDAIAPYTRFVTTETTRLQGVRDEVGAVVKDARGLRGEIGG
jgi:hypothetical protein